MRARAVATGDEDVLEDAMRRHGRRVFSIALRMLGDAGAAEEVAQDVFLELNGALPRLENEDHLRRWLRRVAVCRATDALRRRRTAGLLLVAGPWDEERFADAPVHGRGAAKAGGHAGANVWARETDGGGGGMSARLEQLVLTLPPGMRAAVVLRYGEEMGAEEIAEATGQPLATVKSDLRRGLDLLRRKAAVMLKEFVRA